MARPLPWVLPTQLGTYRLLERLGGGAMGEVFRARDGKLGRLVALKVLPGRMAESETRLRRFLQEAKAASSLNHPNIVTVYEVFWAHVDGDGLVHCISMELIEGETLRAWLAAKPSLDATVDVFAQVAGGLAKAHAAGIVHRDLKPENVMVTREGFAKILDFGLAKLTPAPGAAPADRPLTHTGVVLGTIAYMAPEQGRGNPVDGRSDVFSLGTMLFEALSGERAFAGTSAVDTLHRILHADPPELRAVRPDLPPELHRIVGKCLAKDPEDRYQETRDLAVDLRSLVREDRSSGARRLPPAPGPPPATRPAARWVLLLFGVAAAVALALALSRGSPLPRAATAPSPAPGGIRVAKVTFGGDSLGGAISPDGRLLVRVVAESGGTSLWVRQVATGSDFRIVPPANAYSLGVVISRDGDHVYFVRKDRNALVGRLLRVPILGGTPRVLVTDVDSTVTFSPDGKRLAFVRYDPKRRVGELFIARADGSGERVLATRPNAEEPNHPAWSPDGRWVAVARRDPTGVGITLFSTTSGKPSSLIPGRWARVRGMVWSGSRLLVSAVGRQARITQLWSVAVPGGAVHRFTRDPNHYVGVSVTADGQRLVSARVDRLSQLWAASGDAPLTPHRLGLGSERFRDVAWSPGGRLAYASMHRGVWDLWTVGADGSDPRRVTADVGSNRDPAVSPDGRRVAFSSDRGGGWAVWEMGLDGGGAARRLTRGPNDNSPQYTPDGRHLIYASMRDGVMAVWRVPSGGGAEVRISPSHTGDPALSTDGRYLVASHWDGRLSSRWTLALLPTAGGAPLRTFALPDSADRMPVWFPGNEGFTYIDHRRGVSNIWLQPVDGSPPRRLTRFTTGRISAHAWNPRDKSLAIVRGIRTSDLVMVRGF